MAIGKCRLFGRNEVAHTLMTAIWSPFSTFHSEQPHLLDSCRMFVLKQEEGLRPHQLFRKDALWSISQDHVPFLLMSLKMFLEPAPSVRYNNKL